MGRQQPDHPGVTIRKPAEPKVNAIVIIPIDSAAAGRLIDEAHEQKVPVVSYDVPVSSAKLDFLVARDNAKVGVLQANAASSLRRKAIT